MTGMLLLCMRKRQKHSSSVVYGANRVKPTPGVKQQHSIQPIVENVLLTHCVNLVQGACELLTD